MYSLDYLQDKLTVEFPLLFGDVEYEMTGDIRVPHNGEVFIANTGTVMQQDNHIRINKARMILRPKNQAPAGHTVQYVNDRGKTFVRTGERRAPQKGDWFFCADIAILCDDEETRYEYEILSLFNGGDQ